MNLNSANMGPLGTIFACLVFLLPLLSSVLCASCDLTPYNLPQGCICSGASLVCEGRWPPPSELQQGFLPNSLEELTITKTVHTNLSSCQSTFTTLHSLRTLNLSGNNINFTRPRSFTGGSLGCFPTLKQLILDDNALRLTAHKTFSGLVNLTRLSLNRALVSNQSVSEQLTHTLTKSYLPSLQELMLNNNKLGSLSVTTFEFANASSSNLQRIHLRNCNLGMIFPGTFQKNVLPSLSYIDLSMNNITALVQGNLDSFDKFMGLTVNLTGNPFNCNCQLKEFVTWLNNPNRTRVTIVDRDSLLCSGHGFEHAGKKLVNVTSEELSCRHLEEVNMEDLLEPKYYLLITVLGIIGILALVILFMRRKGIIKFCNQIKQATKETFDTHHTSYVYSDITRATRDTPEHSAVDV